MHHLPYRVLHVEDDPMDARLIGMMLDELDMPPGAVRNVATLAEAIDVVRSNTVDVVFLDLDLPDSEGVETVQRLLASGFDRPVVVLTGHGDDALGLQAVTSGAQDYLIKDDVTANVLARVMRYAVERHHVLTLEREEVAAAAAEALHAATEEARGAHEIEAERRRIDESTTHDVIEGAYEDAIEGWTRVLELRDHDTMGHSRRVADLALALAQRLGLDGDELEQLRRGALLHDIGKIAVPDAILRKHGPLDENERDAMERHTVFARDLLAPIGFLRNAIDVPYAHHERWDGSGYPRGLAGEDIPLAARIFAVVDVYDALTRERPYRPAWSHDAARDYIASEAGRLFDPAVVAAFIAVHG